MATANTPAPFTAEDQTRADGLAEGLRSIADLIQSRPDLAAEYFRWCSSLSEILIPVNSAEDPRAAMVEIMRAARHHGATVTKSYDDEWGHAIAAFGPVKLKVYAKRENVCTRVVTGTETVTVQMPDPTVEVPMVEVEQTREIVEWQCLPLLAEGGAR